jgi:Icc-related predicted phosphoesterase
MKLVLIADTHGLHDKVQMPAGDILVCAGDITNTGTVAQVGAFNEWLKGLPYKHKIIIAGNHDWLFENQPSMARSMITNAIYLQDESVEIEGIKFYGSPWQPWFCNWAFNLHRGEPLAAKWNIIPEDTDVLITHGPPYTILDRCMDNEMVGCRDLLERIEIVKPKLHVFGHIHGGYGQEQHGDTLHVNASICDESYDPIHRPVVIEI